MSKMSQLHAELTQEAYENGFDTLEEYLADKERTKAHEAWLKERDEVAKGLQSTWFYLNNLGEKEDADNIFRAMKFIEEGEM